MNLENKRANEEIQRLNAENQRVNEENQRVTEENRRVNVENQRVNERAKAIENLSIFRGNQRPHFQPHYYFASALTLVFIHSVLLMPFEHLASSIYSYSMLSKSAHNMRNADESNAQ